MKKYFGKYKFTLAGWVFLLLVGVGIDIYAAFFIQAVTDVALSGNIYLVARTLLKGLIYVLILTLAAFATETMGAVFRKKCVTDIRGSLFSKILTLNQNEYSGNSSSHYISIITNDVSTTSVSYLSNIPKMMAKVVLAICATLVLFYFNPILAVTDILIGLLAMVLPGLTGKKVEERQKEHSMAQETSMGNARDLLQGFEVLKSYGVESHALDKYNESNSQTEVKKFLLYRLQSVSYAASEGVTWFAYVVHTVLAAFLVLKGTMTLGEMLGATQVLNHVLNPIGSISRMYTELKGAKASNRRIEEVLNMGEREEGNLPPLTSVTPIAVKHLRFSYDKDQAALEDVTVTFEKGRKYAIVGASGSGKSTLIKLLLKYYKSYEGEICFGNKEASEIDKRSLNQQIAYIQQSVVVFDDSFYNNITMFEQIPPEEVEKAADRAGLSDFLKRVPGGVDGMIEENGKNLSGGEKQRIAIARAFLKGSPVLFLDEATSSLDNVIAAQIEESVLAAEDVTAVVITHKLNEKLLKKYDEIIMMKKGRIVEQGNFETLMEQKQQFYSLYTMEN